MYVCVRDTRSEEIRVYVNQRDFSWYIRKISLVNANAYLLVVYTKNQRACNKSLGPACRMVDALKLIFNALGRPSEKALIPRATGASTQVRVCRQVPTALTSSTAPYK